MCVRSAPPWLERRGGDIFASLCTAVKHGRMVPGRASFDLVEDIVFNSVKEHSNGFRWSDSTLTVLMAASCARSGKTALSILRGCGGTEQGSKWMEGTSADYNVCLPEWRCLRRAKRRLNPIDPAFKEGLNLSAMAMHAAATVGTAALPAAVRKEQKSGRFVVDGDVFWAGAEAETTPAPAAAAGAGAPAEAETPTPVPAAAAGAVLRAPAEATLMPAAVAGRRNGYRPQVLPQYSATGTARRC